MNQLDAMRVFAEVAKTESFSRAAHNLGQSLATVSRKVALLEDHLNAQLLARNTRQVKLTPAGGRYLAGVQSVLAELDQLEAGLTQSEQAFEGALTLTTPAPFGRLHIVSLITEFMVKHPRIRVQHLLSNAPLNYIQSGIDLGLRIGHLPDTGLRMHALGQVRTLICSSPAYIEQLGDATTPDVLKSHRTVAFAAPGDRVHWRFSDARGAKTEVEIDPVYQVDSTEAVARFVLDCGGIGFFYSYRVAQEIASGTLVRLLQPFETPPHPVAYLYPDAAHLPARVRAFIDVTTPRLKTKLAEIEATLAQPN